MCGYVYVYMNLHIHAKRIIARLEEGVVGNDLEVVGSMIRWFSLDATTWASFPINGSDDKIEKFWILSCHWRFHVNASIGLEKAVGSN